MIGKDRIVLCFRYVKLPVKNNRRLKLPFEMGSICSKGLKVEKKVKGSKRPSKKSEATDENNAKGGKNFSSKHVCVKHLKKRAGSTLAKNVEGDKKRVENFEGGSKEAGQPQISRVFSVCNGVDGAQVAAGWPSWLASVAGEAIQGWVPRNADAFEKLDKIGQGTYSSVYRARDLETGKTVALKKVRFVNMDPESVRFMAREILILRRLDHPNVMKLEGLVHSKVSGNLYLVFEYMEHDLTGLASVVKFTEPQIKCFMQQLLRGLEHTHSRGVLHRDIKGSNLLIDDKGNLKIGDFGLANFYHVIQEQPLTSRVVTLWYRPPELLLGESKYGVSVDLWSSGCILAELFVGKPIMPGYTEVEQLHKIFKLCGSPSEEYWDRSNLANAMVFKPQQPYKRRVAETFKDMPSSALSLLETLLAFEPEYRGTTTTALQSEFFKTTPLPCDPSSLPKCPPSKEINIKMREMEARRQRRAAGGKGDGVKHSGKGAKDSKAAPGHHTNAEILSQKRKDQSNLKSNGDEPFGENSHSFNSRLRCASGNSLHVDKGLHLNTHRVLDSSIFRELKTQRSFKPQAAASYLSGGDTVVHGRWLDRCPRARYELINGPDSSNATVVIRKENYISKKDAMHYSGPLLTGGESVEDMLKEHEKRIQIAVRKAVVNKKQRAQ
ncbi:probable serine/threonine-protein kinase At1g09600 [Andrographis paniculata]|uniref:probable serine/threonine-protein kinase At1g09600 n=1 Tax=Andrographis paniculata TaxID=175694 RepID=UPI0021E876CE|nr:probable serine/threonine-protein kinase At1g09600 [Andrographis paniculata]